MEFTLPLSGSHDQTAASYRNWQYMKQRFRDHIFLQHKDRNLSQGGAASLLMFVNGDRIRDIMKSLSSGAHHKTDMLDNAFENIEDLCLPAFILLYERFKFWSIKQQRFEDLRNFVSKLQILADCCELHELRQKYVTDRIVDGVRSEALRKRLRSISDLEFQQALEICETAQGDRIKKYVDVACKEIRGEKEVVRCKPHTAKRKRGIVNGKSSVVKKKCSVDEKKNSVKEKNGRQSSKLTPDQLQRSAQTTPRRNRSARITRTANVADVKKPGRNRSVRTRTTNVISVNKPDDCTEAVSVEAASVEVASVEAASVEAASVEAASVEAASVEAASPSSCSTSPLLKLLNTSLTEHTYPIKTLRKKQTRKSNTQSSVSNLNNKSYGVKTHMTPEADAACQLNIAPCTPNTSMLPESQARTKQGRHVGLDSASRDAFDNEVYSIGKINESQVSGREDISVKGPHVDYFMHLKSEPENPNPCQLNMDSNSQNKHTRKLRKCTVYDQEFSSSGESQCPSGSNLDQKVDTSNVCDVNYTSSDSLSRHMKRTHLDLLTFPCDKCGVLLECQGALDLHKSSLCSREPHSTGPFSRGSHSTEPFSRGSHSTEQTIMCRDCGVSLSSSRQYYQHRKKEHQNLSCDCDQCGLSFPFPSKLKLHLMSKHNATKPFMCEICGSAFAEKNMLTTHKNIHSGEKKHECSTCGRRFLLKTTLHNHLQTHLDSRPHTCNICGMGFKLSYYLKSHMKTHSENRERPHICSKCGAAFLKLAQLKNHERKHTGEKPYRCHVCGIQFSQLSSMKKHIRHIHDGVKPKDKFSCEYCGLSFTHSCKLKLHLMKHTGERPFACHFCGSTYREKHQLNTHMKIHSASEPFKCPFCTRRFLQKSSLEGHVRKHTGEKPFQCPVCFQNFSHKGYLRDHVKVHDENRERKYKCSICDKAFTCSSHMRSHEKLHNGDKPHKCDICGSRFTKRSSVKKHLKRTHGIHDATAIQAQSSSMGAEASDDVDAGMILSSMQLVHESNQVDKPTHTQPGMQPKLQMDTQTLTEAQTDRSVDIRHTESVEMPVQNHAELQLSHIHSVIRPEVLSDIHSVIRPEVLSDIHSVIRPEVLSDIHSVIRPEVLSDIHSVIRPEVLSDIHPHPHPEMCVGLHTGPPSFPHQIHQHSSIRILHPGLLHTAMHVCRDSHTIPCVTPAVSTQMQQSEHIQDMLVYTLTT